MFHSKKGVSPLVATVLLILFSIALGAVVMSWGEAYIEDKAEFVRGAQETVAGCDAAFINIIKVGGELEICYQGEDIIEVWIENGPTTELYDIHARIVGTESAATRESILAEPLLPADARKVMFRHEPVGNLRQIKLTPIILRAGTLTPCMDKAITIEHIHPCQ